MLLRSSHTKKLFKRSIKSFKSFLSNGYSKLPKSPPCHCPFNPFSCTPRISNMNFSQPQACKHQLHTENKEKSTPPTTKQSQRGSKNQAPAGSTNVTRLREKKNRSIERKDEEESRMILMMSEKLREIEMMDGGNMERVLDIEEVMHYYSRLTCPTYREIVDNFFAEMYTEFLSMQAAKPATATCSGGINVLKRRVRQPRFIKV